MAGATSALYEPLIERDTDAFRIAAQTFADAHSDEELWTAVTRFAVLAYAPSQHGKRSVMACRAAHDVRAAAGERWRELIIECGRYAGESRQPWSEPPPLDPPPFESSQPRSLDELREAIRDGDRARAERWLAARLEDSAGDTVDDLCRIARGDALLILDAARALAKLLGDKGRYALLRLVVFELLAGSEEAEPPDSLDALIDRVVAEKGSVESVRAVLIRVAAHRYDLHADAPVRPLEPYHLARDYAQTLIAHAVAPRLPAGAGVDRFLDAVHRNLEEGENFAEWT